MSMPHAAAKGDVAPPPPLAGRQYRPITGYPGYLVCDAGHVWSCLGDYSRRRGPFNPVRGIDEYTPLKAHPKLGGYLIINLKKPRTRIGQTFTVHKLVLESFVGPRPEGQQARHLDGNPRNNALWNLAWGTRKENAEDVRRHGTMPNRAGEANNKSKLTDRDVRKIRELAAAGITSRSIALRFQVSSSTVQRVISGKLWRHIPR